MSASADGTGRTNGGIPAYLSIRDPVHAPFAQSKLRPPELPAGAVPRPALISRLHLDGRAAVVSVVAPAGYGKTTLLAELASHAAGRPLAWVTLDERDDDARLLAAYLAAALESADVPVDALASDLERANPSLATLRSRLGSVLESGPPLTIVLDDVHRVSSPESRSLLQVVVRHLPVHSQLLLGARAEPGLDLTAKNGRVAHVAESDLRLTEEDAGRVLHAGGVDASEDEVAELTARTEGWPAGLGLAVFACQTEAHPLSSFDGSDHLVREYFRTECLADLDPDDVDLLLRLAPLERPTVPMVEAVLEVQDAAERLERLASANVFLAPVAASTPPAYRLHTLFREALQIELERTSPGLGVELAARAADWAEAHGDVLGAVTYASTAGQRDRAVGLIKQGAMQLYQTGHLTTVERWFGDLDDGVITGHPALAVYASLLHAVRGRTAEAERWEAVAAAAPVETVMPDGSRSARPWLALLRATLCGEGKERMRLDAELAFVTLPNTSFWRPTSLLLLGVSLALAGQRSKADEVLREAQAQALVAQAADTLSLATAERSLIAAAEGRWDEAGQLGIEARDAVRQRGLEEYATSALAYTASARSAAHLGDWVRVRPDLAHAEDLLPMLTSALPWLAVQVRLELAQTHIELSEAENATPLVKQAGEILARNRELGTLAAQADQLAYLLEDGTREDTGRDRLTPAEIRLLPLLMTHLTFREIGEFLNVSRNTVKTQAISTYRKLGVASRSEAIARAIELGFVEKPEVLDSTTATGGWGHRR
jgi:LuxR family maltose regulon positive regulatory protein